MEDFIIPSTTGKHRMPCPQCNKGPRDDALECRVYYGCAWWNCFRCGWSGCTHDSTEVPSYSMGNTKRPLRIDNAYARKTEAAAKLMAKGSPVKGTSAEAYLRSRGIALPEDTPLRFHGSCWHWPSARPLPAMIAPIVNIFSGELIGLHQTFIKEDGSGKALVDKPRLFYGRKSGGVVKLTPDAAVTAGLAIGEGIETCLSAMEFGYRTWACLDAGNMGNFPVLEGIESLTVLADYDEAGMKAAEVVAARWREAGKEARILRPPTQGQDWNDVVQGRLN